MLKVRVIPVLLLQQQGLYKTTQFKDPIYLGDPINCVRIFNEKEVDELVFLDIGAVKENRTPDFSLMADIAAECFMPFAFGGGIRTLAMMETAFAAGAEKVVLNTLPMMQPHLVREAVKQFGGQSIVVSLDIRKSFLGGYELYIESGQKKAPIKLMEFIQMMTSYGVGELLIQHIDREGSQKGYDINLIKTITAHTHLPVVASGGANTLRDFRRAVLEGGASAVAAGSYFVFHGKHRAVLMTYPTQSELTDCFEVQHE